MRTARPLHLKLLLSATTVMALLPAMASGADHRPELFLENKGQIHDQHGRPMASVRYLLNGPGLNVQLRGDGFAYDTYTTGAQQEEPALAEAPRHDEPRPAVIRHFHRVDLTWLNEGRAPHWVVSGQSMDHLNYYTAAAPEGATWVHGYERVVAQDVWPFVDIEFLADDGGFKYNVVVRPGGRLEDVRLSVAGAEASILPNGELVYRWSDGSLNENVPESHVVANGRKRKVQVRYALIDTHTIGFAMQALHDPAATLIIDPVPSVNWSTMYGGGVNDSFHDTDIDASGNTYACGITSSDNAIATAGAHQVSFSGSNDAMLVKFNSAGARQWATYYGGTGTDSGNGLSLDGPGNIYLCGTTRSSTAIASSGAFKTALGGAQDGYLVKFNANGTRLWGTYYGGSADDDAEMVSCDGAAHPVLCGTTESVSGIATSGAPDMIYGGNKDAYIAEFDANGARLWGTYLGGAGEDRGYGTSNDGAFIYLCGSTSSTSGIAAGASHQTTKSGGKDAYMVKYSGLGAKLWGTYYGGPGDDHASGCLAEPGTGNTFLVGGTHSASGMATLFSHDASFNGTSTSPDPFMAKLDQNGQRVWGTYYGGSGDDLFEDIAMGSNGRIYASGWTFSASGIGTSNTPQPTLTYPESAFLVRFSTSGVRQWGTYFNSNTSYTYGRCGARGSTVVLAGDTRGTTVTTPGCHQATNAQPGIFDGYVVSFYDSPFSFAMGGSQDTGTATMDVKVLDRMLVVSSTTEDRRVDAMLCDAFGRQLGSWQWTGDGAPHELPMNDLAAGTYILRMTCDGATTSVRFVLPD